jgi:hypothetical protein
MDDRQTALERAYGILWRMPDDGPRLARKLLLQAIDTEGQRRGIAWAMKNYGPAPEEVH